MSLVKLAACIAGTVIAASPAMAQYSIVNDSGEDNLKEAFQSIYGGTFLGNLGNDQNSTSFTGTSGAALGLTITRLFDTGGAGNTNLHNPYAGATNDQRWTDGVVSVTGEVKIAGNTSTFGYANGTGTTFNSLSVSAVGQTFNAILGNDFQWAARNTTSSTNYFSLESNNPVGSSTIGPNTARQDHFVSYYVTGLASGPAWLICYEDLTTGDYDFNDLIVQVQVIPLPGVSGMAAAGLLCLGTIRRRR